LDTESQDSEQFMGPYFKEVEQIKQQTKQLKTNVDRLGTLYTSRLEAANTKGMQETSAEIDTLVDATNKLAILVQNKLKQLSQDNDSLKDQAEQRIKKKYTQCYITEVCRYNAGIPRDATETQR